MYIFIPYFGILLGIGVILYVVVKNIPVSGDEELLKFYERLSFRRYLSHSTVEKVDAYAASTLEKMLRKIRVFLLKAERYISGALHRVRDIGGKKHVKNAAFTVSHQPGSEKEV